MLPLTHPIPPECYYEGWVGDPQRYTDGKNFFGYVKPVGRGPGDPLFFTHYSFLGLDPRKLTDDYCNYFENNRLTTLINRSYCLENPERHQGYGENFWGLTASTNPDGYKAHGPSKDSDDGTIAPTAAICAMPYTPAESMAALKHFYYAYGKQLWGPFGFYDAINPSRDWVSPTYLAIDQGPMVPMIENHRTGLCWWKFMSHPDVAADAGKVVWRGECGGASDTGRIAQKQHSAPLTGCRGRELSFQNACKNWLFRYQNGAAGP